MKNGAQWVYNMEIQENPINVDDKMGYPHCSKPQKKMVNDDICVDDPCINMYNEDGTCLVDGRVFSTHLACVLHWFLQHFN